MTAEFEGGPISSDSGLVLLRAAERRLGLAEAPAGCIREWHAPDRLVHTLPTLLSFGMFAIACGHEDADDCNALREGRCPLQIPFRLGQQFPVPEPPLRVILAADRRAPVRVARPAFAVPHRSDFDDDLGSAALAARSQIRSEIQTAVVKRKVNLTGSPLQRMTFVNNDGADESLDNSH